MNKTKAKCLAELTAGIIQRKVFVRGPVYTLEATTYYGMRQQVTGLSKDMNINAIVFVTKDEGAWGVFLYVRDRNDNFRVGASADYDDLDFEGCGDFIRKVVAI